jgi:hypothetical protein
MDNNQTANMDNAAAVGQHNAQPNISLIVKGANTVLTLEKVRWGEKSVNSCPHTVRVGLANIRSSNSCSTYSTVLQSPTLCLSGRVPTTVRFVGMLTLHDLLATHLLHQFKIGLDVDTFA